MNHNALEKLFTKCKSLGYPNSKEEFEKDLQQFVASELDSSQLESISGGSVKNKICASALSALSVLGATSSTGAVDLKKMGNYANKSPGRSWLSKHKEAVITGVTSVVSTLGLSALIASPFIYKQATQSIKYKKVKDHVKKRVPLYFSYLCANARSDINNQEVSDKDKDNIIDGIIKINIDQELRDELNYKDRHGLYKDINAKVMKFNDQVKKFIYLTNDNADFGDIDGYITYKIFMNLGKMIYCSAYSANDIFEYIECVPCIYLELMIYFCPEALCGKAPKMLLPLNEDCTEVKLVDFSVEFLKPNYEGDHSQGLAWLEAMESDIDKQENFETAAYKMLGIESENSGNEQEKNDDKPESEDSDGEQHDSDSEGESEDHNDEHEESDDGEGFGFEDLF